MMKLNVRMALLGAIGCVGLLAEPCFGSMWFRGPQTESGRVGYWNDISNWWTWLYYTEQCTGFSNTDMQMPYGGTAIITNSVSKAWSLDLMSRMRDPYAVVRIENGGSINFTDAVRVGSNNRWDNVPGHGLIDVRPGGKYDGTTTVGYSGDGIVTNAGTIGIGHMIVGMNTGARGLYVLDGGKNDLPYAKDLTVGLNGTGEIVVKSGTFNWYWYWDQAQMIGFMHVGCGTGGSGTITVESGATFQAGPTYLGGCTNACGSGRMVLRGGTVDEDNTIGTVGMDNLWIGAATNENGEVRSDTYGEIRGWGTYKGTATGSCHTQPRSICARMGNGAIIADGEGEERTLDCSNWWQVTNVLFGCETTTNGWFAVNKGAVIMPVVNVVVDHGGNNWSCSGGTNSIGCARGLAVPDLIGAVRISSFKDGWQGNGWCIGAMILAEDRSDAHRSALPDGYRPLGFWKAGTFGDDRKLSQPRNFSVAANHPRMSFRFDSRKVQSSEGHICVLRWNESEAKWDRLSRVKTTEGVSIANAEVLSLSGDKDWTLGTFCVAEKPSVGMVLILK